MKYSAARKINLSSIDPTIWPYETEDVGVSDADSIDEAFHELDRAVAERIQNYRKKAIEIKAQAADHLPPATKLPSITASGVVPGTPSTSTGPQLPLPAGITSKPPNEFNV